MKRDIISKMQRSGLSQAPGINWPIAHFEGGGGVVSRPSDAVKFALPKPSTPIYHGNTLIEQVQNANPSMKPDEAKAVAVQLYQSGVKDLNATQAYGYADKQVVDKPAVTDDYGNVISPETYRAPTIADINPEYNTDLFTADGKAVPTYFDLGNNYSASINVGSDGAIKPAVNYQAPSHGFFGDMFAAMGPILPIAMAFILPGVGAALGESLMSAGILTSGAEAGMAAAAAEGATAASITAASTAATTLATQVGTALASTGLQVAQGVPLDKALTNSAASLVASTGSTALGNQVLSAGYSKGVADAVASVGNAAIKTAATGGDASAILNNSIASLVSSGVSTLTHDQLGNAASKAIGEAAGSIATGGDPSTALNKALVSAATNLGINATKSGLDANSAMSPYLQPGAGTGALPDTTTSVATTPTDTTSVDALPSTPSVLDSLKSNPYQFIKLTSNPAEAQKFIQDNNLTAADIENATGFTQGQMDYYGLHGADYVAPKVDAGTGALPSTLADTSGNLPSMNSDVMNQITGAFSNLTDLSGNPSVQVAGPTSLPDTSGGYYDAQGRWHVDLTGMATPDNLNSEASPNGTASTTNSDTQALVSGVGEPINIDPNAVITPSTDNTVVPVDLTGGAGGLPSTPTNQVVEPSPTEGLPKIPSLATIQNVVPETSGLPTTTVTTPATTPVASTTPATTGGLTSSDVQNLVDKSTAGLATTGALSTLSDQVSASDAATQSAIKSISDAAATSNAATQAQFASLTDAQKLLAAQQAQNTGDVQKAIADVAKSSADFATKLAASDAATKASFASMTAAQQAQATQQAQSTGDLQKSISDVAASSASGIADVQSGLSTLGTTVASNQAANQSALADISDKVAASDAATQAKFASLTDAQKAAAAQQAKDTGDLQGSINAVAAASASGIAGVQGGLNTLTGTVGTNQAANQAALTGLQTDLGTLGTTVASNQASTTQGLADVNNAVSTLGATTQAQYNSLSDAQKAQAAQEAKSTGDLTSAIANTAATAAAATAALAASSAAQTQSVSNQVSNLQAAQNAANQKPLDSSAQMLTSKVQPSSVAKLAELHQLYNSLTPEMKSVFAAKGIAPPVVKENILPSESTVQTDMTSAASGGLISNETSKIIDSLTPKYISSKTLLESVAPQQQESRLGALRHLSQGPLKTSGLSNRMSHGGLPQKYAEAAPEGHHPEFITGVTGYYAQGGGTGQSDDIPAMLHDGDFVMDADTVASLGDGSSKAGAEVLEKMRKQVPHREQPGGTPVPAKIADGEYVFPASFVTAIGGGSNKVGSERLNEMREKIRAHKRSAPTTKIPPKALSPLDYLKRTTSGKKL